MRLTVETGPLAGTVVSLDRDTPAVLGSGEDCALRVQEAGVQEQHAVVKALRGEGFGLKALAAGIRVNGVQIEATPLEDGDVIQIGTTRIAFGEMQRQGLPTISGYRIQEELGRGGMGMVYRAEQVSLHRQVALKVLNHELTEDPEFVTKFVAEAQAAAKLQHPNVVSVFDVEHDGDTYYYAMELMNNGSCEDWLKQNGAMPVDRALQVVHDAAEGLAYAESLDIVHRDIKPDNLMLDQHGVVKIADLGLAGSDASAEQRAIGTPHFMAPEQVLRKEVNHRTDLYALGCTFYRLVTGRTPFRGQTVKDILRAQVKDEPEPAHKVNNEVAVDVSAIIQRLMAKEPSDRYPTANALLEDLAIQLQPPHKKGWWIGVAAAAVILAGTATWYAINKEPQTVTEYVEKFDDPRLQRFADENRTLKADGREDKATIALLTARLSGLVDEPLAQALDEVAQEHPDTRAAVEAGERATRIRTDIAERTRRQQQLLQQVANHLAKAEQDIAPQLLAHDYTLALQTVDAPVPDQLRGVAELTTGLELLRQRVITQATARLGELSQAIDQAIADNNAEALGQALDTLSDNLAAKGRWPAELTATLAAGQQRIVSGRNALATLLREVREGLWQQYRSLFSGPNGLAARIARLDFEGAAEVADSFAAQLQGEEPAIRAADLARIARSAETYARALEQAAAAGEMKFEGGDGVIWRVARWDRATAELVVLDGNKRAPKEQRISTATLSPNTWALLGNHVTGDAAGLRDCFLCFVLLSRHEGAARAYLTRIKPDDDASGTETQGYPLAADGFGHLARSLPAAGDRPWVSIVRREIEAGQRLAAGLRALSERRNLAAAGHLQKLMAEHPHSYLVMTLP